MTTYQVGEQVLVKSPLTYCANGLNDEMRELAGSVVTIRSAESDNSYRIKEDSGWWWCVNCFEPIPSAPETPINLEGLL